ncbi:LacI family DNA-binding transcriptional regulator [Glacieibacterium sp.]|uniref:LacI family DNA-binding transcriptional regulator n=1 Tax=Glacieibacterium sp. TaxID=2860237 RepID=UPI003B00FDFE
MTSNRKPRQARRTITCYDVAQRAGVSQSSVSRSFRADGVVARATRVRVLAAAAELGYQPNAFAQGLITKRSNLVAIILAKITNLTYPEMLANLTDKLSQRGMRALLFTLDSNAVPTDVLEQVWRFRVDGAIAIAQLTPDQIDAFADHDTPLVLYNRISDRPVGSVCCDSIRGEAMLVDGLLAAGHRRIGIIAGLEDSHVGTERLEAALGRLKAAGYPVAAVARGNYDYASGRDALRALMAEAGTLDAVVCANDLMAIGAIDAARDMGLRVPDDLSVVGFDGVGAADWTGYRLTTIRQPVEHMVSATVSMLFEHISDPDHPAERRLFMGEFVRGGSARIA